MTTGRFIVKATLLIAFFKLMSLVLGLARDAVIAKQFGISMLTDAYIMALKMPNMLFAIIGGALVTVVVPVFTEYAARGQKDEAWKIFNTVMIVVTLFFLGATVIGVVGAPILVKLVAPGFTGEAEALTVELTRIVVPLMIFAGLANLFMGLLNANNIFGLPAFSNSVNNIIIILSALSLGKLYGIHGLALGTVLAMAAMAFVQLPALVKAGFRFRRSLNLDHPGVQKVYWLAAPAALGIAVNQFNVYIVYVMASWLPVGSVSALSFADRLIQVPVSLFVLALGTAVFPTLSRKAAEGDRESLSGMLLSSLKVVFLGTIPASVGLMIFSHPIVTLVYKRDAFDQSAVEMTVAALVFYAIGLLGQAATFLLIRGFYSLQDTRTPVKISIFVVFINLAFSLVLIRYLQHGGLALANSLSNVTSMFLLMWFLGKKLPGLRKGGLWKFLRAVLVASGLMAAASYAVSSVIAGWLQGTAGLAVQVGVAIIAGVFVYAAAIFLMKIEEARIIWNMARDALLKYISPPAGK